MSKRGSGTAITVVGIIFHLLIAGVGIYGINAVRELGVGEIDGYNSTPQLIQVVCDCCCDTPVCLTDTPTVTPTVTPTRVPPTVTPTPTPCFQWMCHQPDGAARQDYCCDSQGCVDAHEAHGDTFGKCE